MRLIPLSALLALAAVASAQAQPPAQPAAPPAAFPRAADGHPNLNGYWTPNAAAARGAGGGGGGFASAPASADPNDLANVANFRNGDISNLTNDGVPARRASDNLPLYKPQFWEKVLDLDLNGNQADSYNHCNPMGLPRMGAPARIIQIPGEFVLFYGVAFQHNQFRSIPLGARKAPIDRDGLWLGDPVARWDGDTLVIETEGFNTETWIGPQGFFHSYEMKLTERFRPEGDHLVFDVTVEDPEVLQKPWVMDTRNLYRITNPNYRMEEQPPCQERDLKDGVIGKQREM